MNEIVWKSVSSAPVLLAYWPVVPAVAFARICFTAFIGNNAAVLFSFTRKLQHNVVYDNFLFPYWYRLFIPASVF